MTGEADKTNGTGAVLRRKLRAGAAEPAAARGRMPFLRALDLALARAANRVLGAELSTQESGRQTLTPETLQGLLPDPGLYGVLDDGEGRLGLVALCPQLVAAIVEVQTIGSVLPGTAEPRRPTSTDAAIAAPFLDAALAGAALLAEGLDEAALLAGMRCAGTWQDPRSTALGLRAPEFQVWTLELSAEGGAKKGQMFLALPAEPPAAPLPGRGPNDWGGALRQRVGDCPARLEAVLARLTVPLARAEGWQLGDVVQLTGARLSDVELCDGRGGVLRRVRLGRANGLKAVRLPAAPAAGAARPAPPGIETLATPEDASVPEA